MSLTARQRLSLHRYLQSLICKHCKGPGSSCKHCGGTGESAKAKRLVEKASFGISKVLRGSA